MDEYLCYFVLLMLLKCKNLGRILGAKSDGQMRKLLLYKYETTSVQIKEILFGQTSLTFALFQITDGEQQLELSLLSNNHHPSTDVREEISIMTAQNGILRSPSYPQYYPNNADCIYIIKQPTYTVFKLNFLRMDIDECTQGNCSSCCRGDYIEIRDGQSEISPLLKQLCGNDSYEDFHNKLFLR